MVTGHTVGWGILNVLSFLIYIVRIIPQQKHRRRVDPVHKGKAGSP